ncbi:ABC transporter permease [Actinopolymorpha pittospori]|uniref:Peptide/nickel transport system permease protein n=1 Tax=Actinopolymorpha pittospori TaxID=648752 RepID=A0A927RAS0_9ACTN|nr:ABC transporter permease [Actinopolymorpha pittospori]MBE1607954.1 peptide/nickel transport system permease protein [Actinopolymorpha pittospori]
MRTMRFTPRFWASAGIFAVVVLFGLVGPLVLGGKLGEGVGGLYDPPSGAAWLGTDDLGHDVFTNLMFGTRTSLIIGLVAGAIATVIGVVIGLIAGYHGGIVEEALMGATNVALAIPSIVVLILLSVALDFRSVVAMAIVIAITSWPWTARAVRAQASSVRTREHLDVARLSGAGTWNILVWDVLPYLMSYICMAFVLQVSGAILAEAGLSLLGLGPSGSVSLGIMLNWALVGESLLNGAWWAFIPPTALLTLIAFALLMLQSSLDEVFNPRLRRGGRGGRGARAVAAGPVVTSGALAVEQASPVGDLDSVGSDQEPAGTGDHTSGRSGNA